MASSNRDWPAYSMRALLARLPASAQSKYRAMSASIADIEALNRSADERASMLRDELARLAGDASRNDDKEEAAALQTQVDTLRDELEALARARSRREGLKANTLQCKSAIEQWLANLEMGNASVAGPLRPANVTPRFLDDETVESALLRVRRDIAGIKNELARIAAAPLPPQQIRAEIERQVEALAAQGRPRLDLEGGKVGLTFADQPAFANAGAALTAPSGSATRWLCWLFQDEIVRRLTVGVDGIENGLTREERETRTAELQRHMLAREHEEEALIVRALALGLDVHRRPGANVLALLELEAVSEPVMLAAE